MSLGPLLLRVILILTFVLNGTTSAMAAAQMSLKHQMPQNEAMQHAAEPANDHEGMPACHDDGMDAGITGSGTHDHASPSIPSEHHEQSSDCCDAGSCRCVCAHGMHATIPSPAMTVHAYGWIDESSVPIAGHAAPDLPHLIRPPIG